MSNTGDAASLQVKGSDDGAGRWESPGDSSTTMAVFPAADAAGEAPVVSSAAEGSVRPGEPPQVQAGAEAASGQEDLELLTRFLVGILVFGSDELMQRIQEVQRDLEAGPDLLEPGKSLDEATTLDLLRYLSIGLLMRGQRRAVDSARRGIKLSVGTASWFFSKLDGLTDNRFTRPIRRPIESRLRNWGQEAGLVIREGRLEEQRGRLLAGETIGEIVDDVIGFVSENPDMQRSIQRLIGRQSVGIASVMRDNARQVTSVSDDTVEGLVRRLLRRQPRTALPPSPLAGKPQTMYSPETTAGQADNHDE